MNDSIKILYTTMIKHTAFVNNFEAYEKAMDMYEKYQNVQHVKIEISLTV